MPSKPHQNLIDAGLASAESNWMLGNYHILTYLDVDRETL
jgi:hypothetical protein